MEISSVLIKPYNTEKTYSIHKVGDITTLTFLVNPRANKYQIAEAFQAIYGIKPAKVNTVTKHPTLIRTSTARPGYTKLKKVAYVVLPKGVELENQEEASSK